MAAIRATLLAATTEENVRLNVKRLIERCADHDRGRDAKKIAVAGGVYDIATGKINLI